MSIESTALKGLHSLADSLIDSVFIPFSEIKQILITPWIATKTFPDWQPIAKSNTSLIICAVIAILYIIVAIIGNFIYCCCCCCCSKNKQTEKEAKSNWKYSHLCFAITFGILLSVASIFIFMTNNSTHTLVPMIPNQVIDILNNFSKEILSYGQVVNTLLSNANTMLYELTYAIKNLGPAFVAPLVSTMTKSLQTPFNQMEQLPSSLDDMKQTLVAVDSGITNLKSKSNTVNTDISNVQSNLKADTDDPPCTNSPQECTNLKKLANSITYTGSRFNTLGSLASDIDNIDDILNQNIGSIVSSAENMLSDLGQVVEDSTSSLTDDILIKMKEINDTVNSSLEPTNKIESMMTDLSNMFDGLNSDIEGIKAPINDNIKYVYGGTLGFNIFLFLLALLGLLLIGIGLCGNGFKSLPWERSSASNFSGICLRVISIILSFIGAIVMILTFGIFILGGATQRWLCEPLKPEAFELLDILEQDLKLYNIDESISSSGLTWNPARVNNVDGAFLLNSCRANESLWDIFELDNVSELDISTSFDVSTFTSDIEQQVEDNLDDMIETSIANHLNGWTANIDSYINDIETTFNGIPFAAINTEIGKGLSESGKSMDDMIMSLESIQLTSNGDADIARDTAVSEMNDVKSGSYKNLKNEFVLFTNNVNQLIDQKNALVSTLQSIKTELSTVDNDLTANLATNLEAEIKKFINDIDDTVNDFITNTPTVLSQMLECKGIYNVYNSAIYLVCDNILGNVQVLWWSLGWAAACIPFIVISQSLLSGYFRRKSDLS